MMGNRNEKLKENKKALRVAIYCRVGRDNDNDAGQSLRERGDLLRDTGEMGRVSRRKK